MRRQHDPFRAMENCKEMDTSDSTRNWPGSLWPRCLCLSSMPGATYLPREMWTWVRNNPEGSGGAGHTGSGPVCRKTWIVRFKVNEPSTLMKSQGTGQREEEQGLKTEAWGALKNREERAWKFSLAQHRDRLADQLGGHYSPWLAGLLRL